MNDIWNYPPKRRFEIAKSLNANNKAKLLNTLLRNCPQKDWPYGMPFPISAILIFIGASPGNSSSGESFDYTPTFGKPHSGIFYKDTNSYSYWKNIRAISEEIIKNTFYDLSNLDPLNFIGQLNLSTQNEAEAIKVVVKTEMAKWVAQTIETIKPSCVILNGLKGILENSCYKTFNYQKNPIDWKRPHKIKSFEYIKTTQKIRFWYRGGTTFILLPNHTGKPVMKDQKSKKFVIDTIISELKLNIY